MEPKHKKRKYTQAERRAFEKGYIDGFMMSGAQESGEIPDGYDLLDKETLKKRWQIFTGKIKAIEP